MKRLIAPHWTILALLVCFNSNAQDIIYTISGEINSQKTSLDSIAIENLSKQSTAGFGNLPVRDDYRISLIRNEFLGSTSATMLKNESGLFLVKNMPGTMAVAYRGQNTVNANISLHDINGQRFALKENQILENGSMVELEIGLTGVYFLTISTPQETRSFKATGANALGSLNIATQLGAPTPLKSGQVYTLAGSGTEKGDNMKVSVFKEGYIAQPVEMIADENKTLVFPLKAQTAPVIQTLAARNILSNSATLNGNVASDGNSPITKRGFYWSSTNKNPGEGDNKIVVEGTKGSYSAELSGLEHATTYYARAYASNYKGTSYANVVQFKTSQSQTIPTVTTTSISSITRTTALGGGNVTSDGGAAVTARGLCWNTIGNPTISDSKTSNGTGTGTFTSSITGLSANTTYYVRAYATNSMGTAYGEQKSVTTSAFISLCSALDNCNLAFTHSGNTEWFGHTSVSYYGGSSVQSGPISHSQQSTLVTTVTGPGILRFYWKVSSESSCDKLNFYIGTTLKDNISGDKDWQLKEYEISEGNHTLKWSYTKDGSGSSGQDCGWLDKIAFTTVNATIPTVTTARITNILLTTASSGGEVISSGLAAITARGVCWNTTGNPSITDNKTTDKTGTGTYISNITELAANTTYYVRAYATNSQGTAYGSQVTFKTLNENEFWWQKDTQTTVIDVTNPATGRTWMDRNLGASCAATSSKDSLAYGDLYQWGRAADGHQKRNSPTTSTLSQNDTPGHGSFILSKSSMDFDWRSPDNNFLWDGFNGINNPCPSGYRLPTLAELNAERQSWSSYSTTGAFASPLKLPLAGCRSATYGRLQHFGSEGNYWSSTLGNPYSWILYFDSGSASKEYRERAGGYSVRCIKDDSRTTVVTTTAITSITATSVKSGGNITYDGGATISARGVCWNTTGTPTTDDNKTTDGTGVNIFISNITGLTANTTYYLRAYATISQGTSYGGQVTFKTLNESEFWWQKDSETAMVDVTNPTTGKTWMDRNLGASRAATSSTDSEAYGDLYQWGRAADGHQERNSLTTSTLSRSDTLTHGNFIVMSGQPGSGDWRSSRNNNLWQGVNGINNPCPSNYRLPTEAEWNAELLSWSSNHAAGSFVSPLKLITAGYRNYVNGVLYIVGTEGQYWSSTVHDSYSRSLSFTKNSATIVDRSRAIGLSVRCIKD